MPLELARIGPYGEMLAGLEPRASDARAHVQRRGPLHVVEQKIDLEPGDLRMAGEQLRYAREHCGDRRRAFRLGPEHVHGKRRVEGHQTDRPIEADQHAEHRIGRGAQRELAHPMPVMPCSSPAADELRREHRRRDRVADLDGELRGSVGIRRDMRMNRRYAICCEQGLAFGLGLDQMRNERAHHARV
ncbi:MAG TPA: hypothetical protein VF059_11610 [Casimicrobiaceae bacterium]